MYFAGVVGLVVIRCIDALGLLLVDTKLDGVLLVPAGLKTWASDS